MKIKTTLLLAILIGSMHGKAADIYVNSSGLPGTYTTISAAISASNNGDKIYMNPYAIYNENITVDKSLTLSSNIDSATYTLSGTLTIEANQDLDIRMIGGSFNAVTINSGTASETNKCKITFVGSQFGGNLNSPIGVDLNMFYCNLPNTSVTFRSGKLIGCNLYYCTHQQEDGAYNGDTCWVIANDFGTGCSFNFSYYNFYIANNKFSNYYCTISGSNSSGANVIVNNEFIIGSTITYGSNLKFQSNTNYSNTVVVNNKFTHSYTGSSSNYTHHVGTTSSGGFSAVNSPYFAYNNFMRNVGCNSSLCGVVGASSSDPNNFYGTSSLPHIDKGHPAIEYYDIDLTLNDIGIYGGPYTWDNYYDNNASGNARIYLLDMPFELFQGQTPTIKAEGVHE